MLGADSFTSSPAHTSTVTRRARLLAVTIDLGLLVALNLGSGVLAALWLLARTNGGSIDVERGDATIAMALWLSATPAWAALLTLETIAGRVTPGQARAGLVVVGGTTTRIIRLLIHPLAAPAWLWMTILAMLAAIPWLPLGLASMTIIVAGSGAISAALAARSGTARGLHDFVAGTWLEQA